MTRKLIIIIVIVIAIGISLFAPYEIMRSQDNKQDSTKSYKEKENETLKKIADDNAKQIDNLIEQLPTKPKIIVKPGKIVYVKIYDKAPQKKYSKDYIPMELAKLEAAKMDSLSLLPAPLKLPHRRTFLQRIFNTNK